MKGYDVFPNFFTVEEISTVEREFNKFQWELSGWSDSPEEKLFWFKDLHNSQFIKPLFHNKAECILGKKVETFRVYGNGQAHGQCGSFHKDTPGCEYTIVYFLHKNWKPEYGGHLVFIDDNGNYIDSIWPETNSAVFFNSNIKHCALEPTIHCKSQRVSVAYKCNVL